MNHSLLIKLQYDASAVRVSQQASWVGLNWSLSAGGVITRTVRGLDDFGTNGYYTSPALPASVTLDNKSYFDQISAGTMDSEADIFCYSVGPYSGKFVLSKAADGGKVLIDNANNLKIEYFTSHWVLTDAHGYKHYFGTQEITTHDYYYSEPVEISDDAPLSYYTLSTNGSVTTSWYLDSIVSPSKEAIVFLYESDSQSLSFIQKSEKECNLLSFSGECSSMSPRLVSNNKTFFASRQVILDLYLKKILFQNGSIEFKRSDRDDIEYIGNEKPDRLTEIIIKDADNNLIKAFGLHQSYFIDGWKGRLKLDSVSEFDKYGNLKPPYKFSYFGDNLPYPYSKSIDHWGFYNGKSNNALVPELYVPVEGVGLKHFHGADRSPDTVAAVLKRGVLSSIEYPTGGSTNFDYELHEYGILPNDADGFILSPQSRSVIANPGNQTTNATDTFTLRELTNVDFQFNYEMTTEGATNYFSIENFYAYVLRADGTTYTAFSNYDCPGEPDPTCGTSQGTASLVLPAGSYKIQVWYQAGWQTTMSASWKIKIPVTRKKGGGLRIKSITNIENGREASVRRFDYTTNAQTAGATTGRLISKPVYEYYFLVNDPTWSTCQDYYGNYVARMSTSIFPMGLAEPAPIVGYDIVTEIYGTKGQGGKVQHTFMNGEAQASPYPQIPVYISPYNGKLKQSVTLTTQGIQLSKVENDYKIREESALRGVKLYQEHFPELTTTYQVQTYNDYSSWVVQWREKKIENIDAGPLVTETYFYYQNPAHKQVTRIEQPKSDGDTLIIKYKYPSDYSQAALASFVSQMKTQNIIAPVIEEQTLSTFNGTLRLLAGSFTKYDLFNNSIYKPSVIYKLRTSATELDTTESNISSSNIISLHSKYQEEVFFDSYSTAGNLQMFHKPNEGHQIYLWDSDSGLPVAHIINAAETDVAFTSFESTNRGGLTFSGTITTVPLPSTAPTGKRVYNLTSAMPLRKETLANDKIYIISYWSNNGPYVISGGNPILATKTGMPISGWTYYEHTIKTTDAPITITGTGLIDEVRIYPFGARMNTYTYDMLTGMTSSTDTNGITTYFEYDGFQRLKSVKDHEGNVLKRYRYHYANGSQGNK